MRLCSRHIWCRGAESNCGHQPFQGCALPTELPRHINLPETEYKELCRKGQCVYQDFTYKIKQKDRVLSKFRMQAIS